MTRPDWMTVQDAALLLLNDFDALLHIAGLVTQSQNIGLSTTHALRCALRALSEDRT